jgi:hypothetical protein
VEIGYFTRSSSEKRSIGEEEFLAIDRPAEIWSEFLVSVMIL